jgi:hypothetical protein
MQVNSAQDYLTQVKRRVIAKSYHVTPPPQSQKHNSVYISAVANGATRRERFVAPFQGANGGVSGGATYTSLCCLSNGQTGAPGTFSTTTSEGIVRFNVIPSISVTATKVVS